LLIKSSQTVLQDIAVELQISSHVSDEGLADKAKAIIVDMFKMSKDKNLNELYVNDIVYYLRSGISTLRNVRVITPVADVLLETDKVITLGNVIITIVRL